MSSNYPDGRGRSGGGDATQFFGQMMMMPFSAVVYGLQIFMQMLQGMQQMSGPGMGMPGMGGSVEGGAGQSSSGAGQSVAANTGRTTREEERTMSEQKWSGGSGPQTTGGLGQSWGSGGDQGWSVREECRDSEPCDRLRLVRFKVLFLKRDLEIAFDEQEELVAEDMPKDGFISWKIAEFIQQMSRGEVKQPAKWKEKGYPSNTAGGKVENGNVISLPDKDKRFLRVFVQVLEWYDRERMNYERDQVDVLRDIRDILRGKI